jgi:hypothetical protein
MTREKRRYLGFTRRLKTSQILDAVVAMAMIGSALVLLVALF